MVPESSRCFTSVCEVKEVGRVAATVEEGTTFAEVTIRRADVGSGRQDLLKSVWKEGKTTLLRPG